MRLIDADELVKGIDIISKLFTAIDKSTQHTFDAIKAFVESMETIEAETVRHGKWSYDFRYRRMAQVDAMLRCSECGLGSYILIGENLDFCPKCGAKMD